MPSADYAYSVFVNCPFDAAYQSLFDAIVFAVHDCGYIARCALEVDDSSGVRSEKIAKIIAACKFGIHDISRTGLDSANALPRFNMPNEDELTFLDYVVQVEEWLKLNAVVG